jgi:hypothetical protein
VITELQNWSRKHGTRAPLVFPRGAERENGLRWHGKEMLTIVLTDGALRALEVRGPLAIMPSFDVLPLIAIGPKYSFDP